MAYMNSDDDDAGACVALERLRARHRHIDGVIQSPRLGIYREIELQVHVANKEHGGPEHDDTHNCIEWQGMIAEHVRRIRNVGDEATFSHMTAGARIQFRRQMIRVAQLAIAAIETVDRFEETRPKRRLTDDPNWPNPTLKG